MSRNVTFAPGEFYHVYNRGTEKRQIFKSRGDYDRFLSLLYACNSTLPVDLKLQGRTLEEALEKERGETLIDICVFCLMPNHFHLLIKEKIDGGISKFMQKITTGYTMYFNVRHERTGALFQGKFKATHASEDRYLSYLISYIHLNPIKLIEPLWKEQGIKNMEVGEEFLNRYPYSSYNSYLNKELKINRIINKDALPEYFETLEDFKLTVREWLKYKLE